MKKEPVVPIEATLVCEYCKRADDYYPATLALYAERVVSPNTFWWWHHPRKDFLANAPVRCTAGKLFENWLIECVKENAK